jgi:hypothetical protein
MKHKHEVANYLSAQGYSAEGIVTRLRPVKPMNSVSTPSRGKKFFSFLKNPYCLGSYLSYYGMATGGFFTEGKEEEARSRPLTCILWLREVPRDVFMFHMAQAR